MVEYEISPKTLNSLKDTDFYVWKNAAIGGVTHSRKEWKRWYLHPEPETQNLPGEWDAKCEDYIKKMIVLRCLR